MKQKKIAKNSGAPCAVKIKNLKSGSIPDMLTAVQAIRAMVPNFLRIYNSKGDVPKKFKVSPQSLKFLE